MNFWLFKCCIKSFDVLLYFVSVFLNAMWCVFPSYSMGERQNTRRKQPGIEAAEQQEDDAYSVRNIEADILVQESLEPQQQQSAQTNPSVETILATFGNIFFKQQ